MLEKGLALSRKFAEIAPAPILQIHRHQDGYISFATERDGEDFRPLVSLRASDAFLLAGAPETLIARRGRALDPPAFPDLDYSPGRCTPRVLARPLASRDRPS